MNFRQATNQDCQGVQDVVFAALREYGLPPDPNSTDKDLSDLELAYFSKNGYFEVCEEEGKIIGTWGLSEVSPERCELRKMYLASSQRGRGLGKIMMLRALNKARELGYKKVELETASVLKEAIAMYVKYGFKEVPFTNHVPRCDQAFEFDL